MSIGFTIGFPIFMIFKIKINFAKIGSDEFDEQYDSLYENLNLKNFSNISYNVTFLLRRMLFAIIAV